MAEKEAIRAFAFTLKEVVGWLEEGYVFDPWLCGKGYPIMMGENTCYWVLIKPEVLDKPELLAKVCPFKPLPVEPVMDQPAGYGTVFVVHGVNQDEYIAKGYVLLHKDHADVVGPDKVKGTILTLVKKQEEAQA